ncbi:MAG TPA: hypothetical protein VFT12_10120, partial [Thermoanaerobaculia bacterium]|nr:hypothetical protein [Thermoanaerobaculia bacterium]
MPRYASIVLLLAAVLVVSSPALRDVIAQTPAPPRPITVTERLGTPAQPMPIRNERLRLDLIERLEFRPRPFPPRPFPLLCVIPPAVAASDIDPHRSLFVHDRATLDAASSAFTADFSLRRTLSQMAAQVSSTVPGTTAVSLFRQLWDTQAASPGVTSGPHCDDNGSTINDFAIQCPRIEGNEAVGTDPQIVTRMGEYAVLSLVNRLDLAHLGWRNCGEHRIIYGKRGTGFAKNLIIFEAVLPNPRPGCREGCIPVAEFWRSLSGESDPVKRAQALDRFFYTGLPGFRPVVHVDHYSATGVSSGYGSSGSGQIRTNQFLQQPWVLKEFKTVLDCGVTPCTFNFVPIMVKTNPHGPLWNEDDPHVLGPAFRSNTESQLPRLEVNALTRFGYEVDLPHDAGQSISQFIPAFIDNYRQQMNLASTSTSFRANLGGGSLTADQVANRAVAQSCAGCHNPATFGINAGGAIGTVTTPPGSSVASTTQWPDVVPDGFVHVNVPPASPRPEFAGNPAFGGGLGQELSPALLDFFLPDRADFLAGQLSMARCHCRNRFTFVHPSRRDLAFAIESRVDARFAQPLESLAKQLDALQLQPDRTAMPRLLVAREQLLAQRDAALVEELRKNGIEVPEG